MFACLKQTWRLFWWDRWFKWLDEIHKYQRSVRIYSLDYNHSLQPEHRLFKKVGSNSSLKGEKHSVAFPQKIASRSHLVIWEVQLYWYIDECCFQDSERHSEAQRSHDHGRFFDGVHHHHRFEPIALSATVLVVEDWFLVMSIADRHWSSELIEILEC